jgi:hypothetical protein
LRRRYCRELDRQLTLSDELADQAAVTRITTGPKGIVRAIRPGRCADPMVSCTWKLVKAQTTQRQCGVA